MSAAVAKAMVCKAWGGPEKLTHDTTAKEYTYTATTGARIVFFNFDTSYAVEKRGAFKKLIENPLSMLV